MGCQFGAILYSNEYLTLRTKFANSFHLLVANCKLGIMLPILLTLYLWILHWFLWGSSLLAIFLHRYLLHPDNYFHGICFILIFLLVKLWIFKLTRGMAFNSEISNIFSLRRRNQCIRSTKWTAVRSERPASSRCKELCLSFFKEHWDFESSFSRKGGWSWAHMGQGSFWKYVAVLYHMHIFVLEL